MIEQLIDKNEEHRLENEELRDQINNVCSLIE
jgi:hypothetical protein